MMATDDDILAGAEAWRRAGRGVALATVVETWGSAPRPVGSHLVVDGEGNFLGSVSGGCVEGDVVTEAMDVIADGAPAHAGIRRRRRDGLAGRPLLRRPHQGLCRAGRLMRLDILARAQRRARRAPRRRAGDRPRHRRAAARPAAERRRDPLAEPLGAPPCARARAARVQHEGRRALPLRAGAARAARRDRRRPCQPGAGPHGQARRLRRHDHRSAHRLRHAGALPRRARCCAEWPGRRSGRIGLDRFTAVAAL